MPILRNLMLAAAALVVGDTAAALAQPPTLWPGPGKVASAASIANGFPGKDLWSPGAAFSSGSSHVDIELMRGMEAIIMSVPAADVVRFGDPLPVAPIASYAEQWAAGSVGLADQLPVLGVDCDSAYTPNPMCPRPPPCWWPGCPWPCEHQDVPGNGRTANVWLEQAPNHIDMIPAQEARTVMGKLFSMAPVVEAGHAAGSGGLANYEPEDWPSGAMMKGAGAWNSQEFPVAYKWLLAGEETGKVAVNCDPTYCDPYPLETGISSLMATWSDPAGNRKPAAPVFPGN